MKEDAENPSDYIPKEPPSAMKSLAPTLKFASGVWTDVFLLLILWTSLGALYLGAVKSDFFEKVLLGILFIVATKITPKWQEMLALLAKK